MFRQDRCQATRRYPNTYRTRIGGYPNAYSHELVDAQTRTGHESVDTPNTYRTRTGGCPHTAIREDASVNIAAIEDLKQRLPKLDLILIESGGDNLAATFSPELVDLTIYVIDVCMGGDIPRKKGPALMKSDMLVVNKIELAPYVNVDIGQLHIDTKISRGKLPYIFGSMREGIGVPQLVDFLKTEGGFN